VSQTPPTTTRRAAGLLLLAALLGAAVGSLLTARVLPHPHRDSHRHSDDWYINLLRDELALTGPQQDTVHSILARYNGPMDSVWAAVEPRLDSLRTAIRAEVRATLTPEQQARYAVVTARLDADRRTMTNRDSTHR